MTLLLRPRLPLHGNTTNTTDNIHTGAPQRQQQLNKPLTIIMALYDIVLPWWSESSLGHHTWMESTHTTCSKSNWNAKKNQQQRKLNLLLLLTLYITLPLPKTFPWPHPGGWPDGDSSEVGVFGVMEDGRTAELTVLSKGIGLSGSRM